MSNSPTADALKERLVRSQRFWTSSAGKALNDAQRACLGPVAEEHSRGHCLEMSMSPALLDGSAASHTIEWVPTRDQAQRPTSLISPPSELALPDACLEMTIIHHWLEHLPNAEQTLHEAARVTADHGILIIFGFNPLSVHHLTRRFVPGRWDKSGSHTQRHPVSRLTEWLAFVDFTVERVDYCGFHCPLFCSTKKPRCREVLEAWGRRLNVPVGESYMLQAQRKQPQSPSQRVKFGATPSTASHSLGLARGNSSAA
ncbi:methyltransferase domain-containing protein [Halomonas alkaliantarctica]|nr:methyltransferase domain-containing protein [Halomonas alkaliantarctica]